MLHDQNEVSKPVAPSPGSCPAEGMGTDMSGFLERRKMLIWKCTLDVKGGSV